MRAYADPIVVRCAGEVVAEHARCFGQGRTIYDPWHYLPVLARKPGALRNGAPFQDWSLPPALTQLRRKLGRGDEADRRFVRLVDLAGWIYDEYGVSLDPSRLGRILKGLGSARLSARPKHHAQNEHALEAFKRDFPPQDPRDPRQAPARDPARNLVAG